MPEVPGLGGPEGCRRCLDMEAVEMFHWASSYEPVCSPRAHRGAQPVLQHVRNIPAESGRHSNRSVEAAHITVGTQAPYTIKQTQQALLGECRCEMRKGNCTCTLPHRNRQLYLENRQQGAMRVRAHAVHMCDQEDMVGGVPMDEGISRILCWQNTPANVQPNCR